MFADMQRDYHRMKKKHAEAVRAAAKYREDLHNCKNKLKGASEVVLSCKHSLLPCSREGKRIRHPREGPR